VSVEPTDRPARVVRVIASDARHDLALLRGDGASPAVAGFHPQPSQATLIDLALVGFPERAQQPTATTVFLVADPRIDDADQYLFHGDVRHGHSGGPILDPSGRVIGVARGMIDTDRTYRATGRVITELGLAIANRTVLEFLGANGVRYSTGAAVTSGDRLAQARRFLVHVRCWK
jgi:S1-C subfamily serine protease